MVKEIVKDEKELQVKCKSAIVGVSTTEEELNQLIEDMMDTAKYHQKVSNCVGLAANQIGSNLRVILCHISSSNGAGNPSWVVMINPTIVDKSSMKVESEEGCLSVEGTRVVKRFKSVKVLYKTPEGKVVSRILKGFDAIIAQHEIDHLNGKLI